MKTEPNCVKCHYRHPDNGNCTAVGGFCTSVPAAFCPLISELRARAEAAEKKAEEGSPAQPIGRCVECAAYVDNKCVNTGYYKPETGFCDDFEPKGGEENDK